MLLLFFNLTACSAVTSIKNYNRNEDCDKVLKAYRNMIRWNEAEKAAIAFVDKPLRDDYNKAAEQMRRRKVSMVDTRMLAQECLANSKSAEATIEFDYYIMPDVRLRTLTDRQKWIFRESDSERPELGDGWKLVSPLPDFK